MSKAIVILTMARSMSSTVSHIFHKHGVWSGPCNPPDENNHVPYHEIRKVKRLINSNREKIYDTLKPTYIDNFISRFLEILKEVGYKEGSYLIKVDAFCWPLFKELDPIYVKLYRDPDKIMESINSTSFMKKQGYSQDEWRKIIKAHHDEMDKVEGFSINVDEMVGDYRELKTAIEGCGLKFNEDIPREIIY